MKYKVEILMATYNGEKYLEEQLESILSQTYSDWILTIRDDGSNDRTMSIIKKYVNKYPQKIFLLQDSLGTLKAKENFFTLLRNSQADYLMFCDQDDIWLNEKIEKTLKKMREAEQGPTLIHTDLKTVDKNLKIISESFWKLLKLNPEEKDYKSLINQNNITGCTVMINRKLADKCMVNFEQGLMHDWVIGIVASLTGKIDYLNEATILYRQHDENAVGSQKSFKKTMRKIKKLQNYFEKNRAQLEEISKKVEIKKLNIFNEIEEYINLKNKNMIKRKFWIIRKGYLKGPILKRIIQIILI